MHFCSPIFLVLPSLVPPFVNDTARMVEWWRIHEEIFIESLQHMTDSSSSVGGWLDALASDAPAPGGGAAAALCGAIGAALVSMVARFTVGRPKYASVDGEARDLLDRAEGLRTELSELVNSDATAYARVAAAYRLPKSSDEERETREIAIQSALVEATEVPLRIAEAARVVVDLAEAIAAIGNRTVLTDAGSAALIAEAALRAALLNVSVNIAALRDSTQRSRFGERLDAVRSTVAESVAVTLDLVEKQGS